MPSAGTAFRPLVWAADGRPHPAVTRTLRFAASIAMSRNGEQATASALVSRWRHEIQVAIFRHRAAMSRAVLPKFSVKQLWLMDGHVDIDAANNERAPPVDEYGVSEVVKEAPIMGTASPTAAPPQTRPTVFEGSRCADDGYRSQIRPLTLFFLPFGMVSTHSSVSRELRLGTWGCLRVGLVSVLLRVQCNLLPYFSHLLLQRRRPANDAIGRC